MTTIALDTKLTLASDSQATLGGVRLQHSVEKLFEIDGFRVGVAGSYSQALAFIEFLEETIEANRIQQDTFLHIPKPLAEDLNEFLAVVVAPDGAVFVYEGSRFSIPVKPPVAIGSGSDFAESAMALGLSAADAVRHAIKFDVYSGGDVQVLEAPQEEQVLDVQNLAKMTKKQILKALGYVDEANVKAFNLEGAEETA